MTKISKGIPITKTLHPGPYNPKYPFREMKVGDSILLEGKHRTSQAACALAAGWYKATGWKYSCRLQSNGQIRVWRIT